MKSDILLEIMEVMKTQEATQHYSASYNGMYNIVSVSDGSNVMQNVLF